MAAILTNHCHIEYKKIYFIIINTNQLGKSLNGCILSEYIDQKLADL